MVFFRATIDKHEPSLSWHSLPMLALAAVISHLLISLFLSTWMAGNTQLQQLKLSGTVVI